MASSPTPSELPDRDPALAHRLVDQEGAILLDVRSQAEFAGGHLDRAVNIPHTEVAERMPEILALAGGDRGKAVVVYCRSGGRAGLVKQTLRDHGFGRVTNLGGMTDG
jgi:phage shock protein E